MYTPLLKNKYTSLKQVLLCSACFFLFSTALQAQKWEQFIDSNQPVAVITSLTVDTLNDQLVIGGQDIKDVNGQSSCAVYKWSPENGVDILSPYNLDTMNVGMVNEVMFRDDSMLVAGAGGVVIWKNNHWVSKLNSQSSWIRSIGYYNNKYMLSIGRDTQYLGGSLSYLIEWDGDSVISEFNSISGFMSPYPFVNTTIDYQGDLYVGGKTLYYDGVIMHDIIKWDGSNWTTLGNEITHASQLGGIDDMIVYKGELYIIGLFHLNGDTKECHIARWDGISWKSVGGGIGGPNLGYGAVNSLHVHDDYLFVSGTFTTAGGVPAKGVARWDGNEWCGCGTDIDYTVITLTHYRDTLYIGGNFRIIDGDTMRFSARFIGDDFADTCGSTVGIKTVQLEKQSLNGYPNPATNEINFDFPYNINQLSQISVYNSVGQLFIQKQEFIYERKFTLDISMLPTGIYFGEIVTNQKNYVYSFIKQNDGP